MKSRRGAADLLGLLLLLASVSVQNDAASHTRPLSYSRWRLETGGAEVQVQIAAADLNAALGFDREGAPDYDLQAGQLLQEELRLRSSGAPCITSDRAWRVPAHSSWEVWRWTLRCPKPGAWQIELGFPELVRAGHRHLIRVDDGQGQSFDRVLDLASPSFHIEAAGARAPGTFARYVKLGMEHLLSGWDHLAFVFALLLLASRLRDVVALVTSFTIAHSITLVLAALGFIAPESAAIEALIGFSVALLGAENAWLLGGRRPFVPVFFGAGLLALMFSGGALHALTLLGLLLFCACHFALLRRAAQPAGLRIAIAFAFGLIHGFGFAGVMQALELPTASLVRALFGFNLGVELGQLAIVLVAWPALRALERAGRERYATLAQEVLSAAICGLGLFWFVVRNFER
jgi:hypothetical protein